MPASDALARLNAALTGRYAVERELGSGGMATVYLADDLKHHRPVAIKVLRPELAASIGPERFVREVAIAAQLSHPHIVALYDSGDAGGYLFYVMPYIRGETLRQRLQREGRLAVAEAVQITREVAAALDHAHGQGVIHRDIKPENILLFEGEAMIADFGIALAVSAAAGERLTNTGVALGTLEYMSPEQALGERDVDGRSDVYSLACVLYECLAGETPFSGSGAEALIARRLAAPVPPVRRLRPEVPDALDRALARALAGVRTDRFETARAFAAALERADAALPIASSVAVLPFQNLTADPENEYFADGITEDVIAQLSKVRALKVISRTSAMQFKQREQGLREIAAKLNVATVLEGSVRRAGDRVRIVAQLIDAGTDQHLWAETYDRKLTDIFAIQSDVALHIAAALKAELSADERTRIRKEPTSDLQAYQLYLQGRHFYIRFTPEGLRRAIEYFERAIARDPGYAVAYAAVAMAYEDLNEIGAMPASEGDAPGKRAAARALELDGELAEAHAVQAVLMSVRDFAWADAEREFRRALELNPSSADAHDYFGRMLQAIGRFDDAIAMLTRAQELDPLAHRADVATALMRAGRHAEALRAATAGVELDPAYARGHATLGWALILNDRSREGVAELERAVALDPKATTWLAQLGQAYGMVGNERAARQVLAQLEAASRERYVSPYHWVYVHAGLGERDLALDWLERAFEERSGAIYGIKTSFLLTTLHGHPRFTALLRRMNL